MATIKSNLGISSYTSYNTTATNKGGTLPLGSSYNQKEKGFTVSPGINNNDRIINTSHTLFSFSLSREFSELGIFLTPRFSLVVQGRDVNNQSLVKVLRNNASTSSATCCEWNKYFGIVRFSIDNYYLLDFNVIEAIGVVMTTDKRERATGRIFRFSETTNISQIKTQLKAIYNNSNIENINEIIKTNQLCLLSGAEEKPVRATFQINGQLKLSPITQFTTYFYTVEGERKDEAQYSTYTNPDFYYNSLQFKIYSTTHLNNTVYPNSIKINENSTVSISSETGIGHYFIEDSSGHPDFNLTKLDLIYKGYTYHFEGLNKTIKHYSKFGDFSSEKDFSSYLSFKGDRYRTKFNSYTDEKDDVNVDINYLNGTLSSKKDSPFSISGDTIDILIATKKIKQYESFESLPYYYNFTGEFENRFTKTKEEVTINIPTYDEYDYYFIGPSFELQYPGQLKVDCSIKSEFVKYSDVELSYKITTTNVLSVAPSQTGTSIEFNNKSIIKLSPQSTFPKDADEHDEDDSYFEYYLPRLFKKDGNKEEDITNRIKFYWDFDYYTILHCRPFLKNNENIPDGLITELKIQNGKLFYKVNNEGFGDYNSEFSANQFINYAIDGKHPIGLSFFDKKKWLDFYIPDQTEAATKWIWVDSIGTDENKIELNDSGKALQMFYTDILHSIDISKINIPANTPYILLKIRYYDNMNSVGEDGKAKHDEGEYIIFDITLPLIPIVSGYRPLGYRKHGIIINPQQQNEILDDGVTQKIHAKMPSDAEKKSAKIIDIQMHDKNDTIITDATCTIEYDDGTGQGNNQRDKGFYFDGVNLQTLKNTTTENTQTIATILQALESQKLLIKSGSKDYKIYQAAITPDKNVTGSDSISITMDETIPDNAIIRTLLYTTRKTGVVGQFDVTKGTVTKNGNTFTIPYSYIYDCYAFTNDTSDGGGWVTVVAYVIIAFNSIT